MSPPKVSYLPISKSERIFKQKLGAGLKVWGGNYCTSNSGDWTKYSRFLKHLNESVFQKNVFYILTSEYPLKEQSLTLRKIETLSWKMIVVLSTLTWSYIYVFSFYRMPFWQLMHLSTWYHLPKCKNCHNAIAVIARTSYSTLFTCLNIYYNHLVSMRFKHFICVLSINYDHFI